MEIFGIATIEHVFWTACGGILAFTFFVLMLLACIVSIGTAIYWFYYYAKLARDIIRNEMEGWNW